LLIVSIKTMMLHTGRFLPTCPLLTLLALILTLLALTATGGAIAYSKKLSGRVTAFGLWA
jgi:hypothetical protein